MENKKERLGYIDIIKALAMLLVIMGHVNFANDAVKPWIYSFHMPVFFFASGLLAGKGPILSLHHLKSNVWRKTQSLLFPYFGWALIYAKFTFENLLKILYGSYYSISNAGTLSSLWFLPVLFTAIFINDVFRYLLKERNHPFITGIIAVLFAAAAVRVPYIHRGYFWSLNVSFMAVFFYMTGCMVSGKLKDAVLSTEKKKKIMICLCGAAAGLLGTQLYSYNLPSSGYTLMASSNYGNPLIFVANALSGIFLIVCVSVILDAAAGKNVLRWMGYIGSNTLCIFAVQKPVIAVFEKVFAAIEINPFFELMITTAGTMAVCCLICCAVNRYVPILNGRIPKKTLSSKADAA